MNPIATVTLTPDETEPGGVHLVAATTSGRELFAYARRMKKSWQVSEIQDEQENPVEDDAALRARASANAVLRRWSGTTGPETYVLSAEAIPGGVTCLRPRGFAASGEYLFRSADAPGSWIIGTDRTTAERGAARTGAITLRHDDFPARVTDE